MIRFRRVTHPGLAGSGTGQLRAIRALRCLRPLRLIAKAESMRNVINALIRSLPGLLNVGIIHVLLWLVFRCAHHQTYHDSLNT